MSDIFPTDSGETPLELSAAAFGRLRALLSGLDRLELILALPDHPAAADPPLPFGRYRLSARLGAGRFGIVTVADEPALGRRVTVKVPQLVVLSDVELRARFVREGRAAAALDHPGIVPVYDTGEVGGLPYLAAAFVDGPTLAVWRTARGGRVSPSAAARMAAGVARAAHHAHERGVLHCDLTPANVLVDHKQGDEVVPVVTDFGLARILTDDPGQTRTFRVAGTPHYMAPEQARGDRRGLTARTDVYAIGAILFELLTGAPPFPGETSDEVLALVTAGRSFPEARAPEIPRDLWAICCTCLELDPRDRYASAAALADDLDRFLHGEPVLARPVNWPVRLVRWAIRNPAGASAAVVIVALVVALTGVLADRWAAGVRHEAELRAAVADQSAAAARATSAEMVALLEQVRQRRLTRTAGWTEANLADIRRVAGRVGEELAGAFRTEATAALGGVDLRSPRTVGEGFTAYCPAFSPDGRTLALAAWKASGGVWEVRLCDPKTGREVGRRSHPTDPAWERRFGRTDADGCRAVALSPDGRWLVVGSRSGWLVRWDLAAGTPGVPWRHAPPGVGGQAEARFERVNRLTFGADGRMRSGDGRQVVEWAPGSGWPEVGRTVAPGGVEPVRQSGSALPVAAGLPFTAPWPCATGPDGQFAARLDAEKKTIFLFDRRAEDPGVPLTLPDHSRSEDSPIEDLVFSPDGTLVVATAEHAGHISLWDAVGGRLLATRTIEPGPQRATSLRAAFAPGGRTLAVATESRTLLFDLPANGVAGVAGVQAQPVVDADVTPNGRTVATIARTSRGSELAVWERSGGGEQVRLRVREWLPLQPAGGDVLVAMAADGRAVASHLGEFLCRLEVTLAPGASTPQSWHVPGGRRDELAKLHGTRDVRFTRGGVLWAFDRDTIRGWTGKTERVIRAESVTSFAPTDNAVLVGRWDGTISRQTPEGAPVRTEQLASVAVTALAQSEQVVVAGTAAGEVHLLRDGAPSVFLPEAHADAVLAAAVGPRGWFATGAADRTVRVWGPDGREVLTLPQTRPVRRVYWSDDGGVLTVLAAGERAVRQWDLAALKSELVALGLDPSLP